MRELDFIDWIRSQSAFDTAKVPVGPGDDMAIVTCGAEEVLVGTDQVLDGVHFLLDQHGPQAAGRKAMARNLSDVAAMAAVPFAAVASVAMPMGMARDQAEDIYHGLRAIGDQFACPLVGGDVGTWDGALAITVTVMARPCGKAPVLRSGAKIGDAICVTGALGGAWRGERHLQFRPRIDEAVALAQEFAPHAMIDISDGLTTDLAHICKASGVGTDLIESSIPIHSDAKTHGDDPLSAALTDGEDYELLFTLPDEQAAPLVAAGLGATTVTRIGTIVAGDAMTLVAADGHRRPLKSDGWEHAT